VKYLREYFRRSNDKRLFLFIHYYDVHSDKVRLPYDSPPPYNTMFYPNYKGTFTGGDGKLFASKYLRYVNENNIKLKKDDLKYMAALYDGGIAYTDKCIGSLFGILKRMELYDQSLIILTADHGEEFQEHGFVIHSNPWYHEELVRAPLIVKLPGPDAGGKVVPNLVENIDIMPSILSVLGVRNVPDMQGADFMKVVDNSKAAWKDYVFGYSIKDKDRAFIRTTRWKILTANIHDKQQFKMFDLLNDPAEKSNVMGNPQDITKDLKEKLLAKYARLERPKSQEKVTLTTEEIEKLKSLGYVQ
jgi:arylsulfatase A-like enzyme